MLDITAIILTYNEELHINRCLDRIASVVKSVYLIDTKIVCKFGVLSIIKPPRQITMPPIRGCILRAIARTFTLNVVNINCK